MLYEQIMYTIHFMQKYFDQFKTMYFEIVRTSFMHDVLSPNYVQKYRCKHKFQLQKYFCHKYIP